jgi:hypothetical protein
LTRVPLDEFKPSETAKAMIGWQRYAKAHWHWSRLTNSQLLGGKSGLSAFVNRTGARIDDVDAAPATSGSWREAFGANAKRHLELALPAALY